MDLDWFGKSFYHNAVPPGLWCIDEINSATIMSSLQDLEVVLIHNFQPNTNISLTAMPVGAKAMASKESYRHLIDEYKVSRRTHVI